MGFRRAAPKVLGCLIKRIDDRVQLGPLHPAGTSGNGLTDQDRGSGTEFRLGLGPKRGYLFCGIDISAERMLYRAADQNT
jgi:hypothetical protein